MLPKESTEDGKTSTNLLFCVTKKWQKFKEQFPSYFEEFSSYKIENFKSFDKFTKWMHRPTDAASIGIGRMLFGLAMLIDIPEERGGGTLDLRFGDPKDCHFPFFDFIRPLPLPQMGIVYLVMWLGALGVMFGYKFRISILMFVIPYWYVFLLDKTVWNNHSYLYGLCGLLFLWTDSHRYCSIDYRHLKPHEQTVPYWNYFLLKFQFFILYFMAGLKKMTIEWLSGYAMTNLGYHWVFIPFRLILGVSMTELLIIHWFGAIFDLTIAFLLIYRKTRLLATPFNISFHLMNSRLFTIGMFPWVCLAELPLFYPAEWPRILWRKVVGSEMEKLKGDEDFKNSTESRDAKDSLCSNKDRKDQEIRCRIKIAKNFKEKEIERHDGFDLRNFSIMRLRILFILFYCCLQFFLPYSHFITKGYNNWTNGIYGYSWDMMVHSYDTILTSVKVVDNGKNESRYLEPYAFTSYDRWTKHADMAVQYAKCIEKNIVDDFRHNPKTQLTSENISIYFDIWCSMNGRFQQRVFDPRMDILKAEWNPFKKTEWVLSLLTELNYMRPKIASITQHVLSWSNHSDVLFIADFPDLIMENFISADLINVSLTVLEGAVRFEIDQDPASVQSLSSGQHIPIRPGQFHRVTTVSQTPSTYMYTFFNKTMEELNIEIKNPDQTEQTVLPLWNEFLDRVQNYRNFFMHVGNAIMFLIYGVPMPRRIRDPS